MSLSHDVSFITKRKLKSKLMVRFVNINYFWFVDKTADSWFETFTNVVIFLFLITEFLANIIWTID